MKKVSVLLAVSVCALAGLSLFLVSPAQSTPEDVLAGQILTATGLQGGLIVHLNCGDGKLTATGFGRELSGPRSGSKYVRHN